ncbi:MAG: hypothetical protein R3240_07305, partial [Gammaproteobacteria bacterium]|nr:hypothetical protein [Gammaproteobacteria bacterium]
MFQSKVQFLRKTLERQRNEDLARKKFVEDNVKRVTGENQRIFNYLTDSGMVSEDSAIFMANIPSGLTQGEA